MKHILTLGVSVVGLAACSQPPAPVAHKGEQFYGRDNVVRLAQAPHKQAHPKSLITAKPRPPIQADAAPVPELSVAELPVLQPQTQPQLQPQSQVSVKAKPVRALPASLPEPARVPMQQKPAFKTAHYSAKQKIIDVEAPQLAPLPLDELDGVTSGAAAEAVLSGRSENLAELNQRSDNFIWPAEGKIVSRFGKKPNGLVNDGINIEAREGEPIWAAAGGEVVYAGNELKGYGNMVIVRHANGWMSAYAHASDMLVDKGDAVEQGDLIGYVGMSGAVQTAQLHFGIRDGKTPVDPETLLPRRMAAAQ